jgi:hypothetical protein
VYTLDVGCTSTSVVLSDNGVLITYNEIAVGSSVANAYTF